MPVHPNPVSALTSYSVTTDRSRKHDTQKTTPKAPTLNTLYQTSPTYQPLIVDSKEIRVLRLHPGNWTDIISCSIQTISLVDHSFISPDTAYEALSYVWAAEPGTEEILVDNQFTNVTRNLFFALRRLRKISAVRTIWVDAVCIDQRNEIEKGHQVAMMGTIYSSCIRAYLWLGEPKIYEGSSANTWTMDECMHLSPTSPHIQKDMVSQVHQLIRELSDNYHRHELSCFQKEEWRLKPEVLSALGSMMASEWFTRLWVVQEALLPPQAVFLWGSFPITLSSLKKGNERMWDHFREHCCGKNGSQLVSEHAEIMNNFGFRVQGLQLPSEHSGAQLFKQDRLEKLDRLLWCFSNRRATQPVDIVYGLLGLPCSSRFEIIPNYSITKQELYTNVAINCMKEEGHLDVLKGWKKSYDELPSWVHDWSMMTDEKEWAQEINTVTLCCYDASADLRACIEVDHHNRLTLSGIFIDTVTGTTETLDNSPSNGSVLRLVYGWYNMVCKTPSWKNALAARYKPLSNSWKTAFRATVTGDLYPGQIGNRNHSSNSDETFELWLKAAEAKDWSILIDHKTKVGELFSLMSQMSFYRSLFKTSSGYLGWGRVEDGDEVWVLLGGDVPFVLRPVAGSTEYRLVGDCYLHGIMDGEAVTELGDNVRSVVLV